MPLLNKHNLELAKLASKEESRFTLNGILVQPESTVVTDGHILMEITTPSFAVDSFPEVPGIPAALDTWKPFVLSTADALGIAKAIPKKQTIPILAHAAVTMLPAKSNGDASGPAHDEYITIVTTDLERANPVTIRRATSNFPDYKRVTWPIGEEEFAFNVNARNLADVLDFVAKFNDSKRGETSAPDCVLRFKSNSEAMRIDAKSRGLDQTCMALVMPMRLDGLEDSTSGLIKECKSAFADKATGGLARAKTAREMAESRLVKLRGEVENLEKLLGVSE